MTSGNGNAQENLSFDNQEASQLVFGPGSQNLRALERAAGVHISTRGGRIALAGPHDAVRLINRTLTELYRLVLDGYVPSERDSQLVLASIEAGDTDVRAIFLGGQSLGTPGRAVNPKSTGQKQYIEAMRACDIVFAVGPAGTGKTYLAMAMALAELTSRRCQRIILARPAVEAGEKLGFLPGDLAEKVNPYLRPLYDALHDMMDLDKAAALIEKGIIEIAPLAFMRGRTPNRAFVILDEAQNTTHEQMKMFLTRLGRDAKAVVTGDITQIDLPGGTRSGLVEAIAILGGITGIGQCRLDERDVVRHPLVAQVIKAYAAAEASLKP